MSAIKHFAGTVGFVLCTVLLGVQTGRAAEVTIRADSDFYQPLSSYGQWQVVGSYGNCWIPGGVAAGWSPYSNGYWQYTDAGWYWTTDEPWGWATYHYGSWDLSPQYGWYWVPQTQWAPAWVSWREGGGYIGWAPLGPSGRAITQVNVTGTAPGGYVYVQESQFLQPVNSQTIIVNKLDINRTTINKGPDTTTIEKASGRTVQAVPVDRLRQADEAKAVARHPASTSTSEKAVQTPAPSLAEKAIPSGELPQVLRPAGTTAAPQPTATQNQTQQTDEQKRLAKLDEDNRARQENAQEAPGAQPKPIPGAVQAQPETRPNATVQPRPVADRPVDSRPAATQEPADQKADQDNDKKN